MKILILKYIEAHQQGEIVHYFGYTSAMKEVGSSYDGNIQLVLSQQTARDLEPFSIKGEKEVIIPRGSQYKVGGDAIIDLEEIPMEEMKKVKDSHKFAAYEPSPLAKKLEAGIKDGSIKKKRTSLTRRMQVEFTAGYVE